MVLSSLPALQVTDSRKTMRISKGEKPGPTLDKLCTEGKLTGWCF